jgi:hypothetical protein
VCPEAGEAALWQEAGRPVPEDRDGRDESAWGELTDEERAERNEARALSRARTEVRRYCVRNRLDRMWTLTFRCWECDAAPCACGLAASPSLDEAWRAWDAFVRRLRRALGRNVPLLAVVERGSKGTRRLHVHVAVGFYVKGEELERVWGHGHVKPRRSRVAAAGKRERARRAAGYLSKYLSKELGQERAENGNRYRRAQGFAARVVRRRRLTAEDARWFAARLCGGNVVDVWRSEGDGEWRGPPVVVVRFGDPDP